MEKLDPTQRESIKKMSNIRLSAKLLEVGVDESQIQAMDRAQMIAAWAEIVLAGKDKQTSLSLIKWPNKMVKTGQFTTKCKGNKVIALKLQKSLWWDSA